jgi:predicted nucleotidyltransferase
MWSSGSVKVSMRSLTLRSNCSCWPIRGKETILLNSDLLEFLDAFRDSDVRFLVVGGYAVMKYTEPRTTKDIDLWIETTPENAQRVYHALTSFGAPLGDYTPADFTDPNTFFQIGVAFRVDLITSMPEGLTFADAWERRVVGHLHGKEVSFICIEDLINVKRAVGRPQDQLDLQNLLNTLGR